MNRVASDNLHDGGLIVMSYRLRTVLAFSLLGGMVFASTAVAADARPTPLGRTIEDFTLNDYLGAKRAFSEWKDRQAIVVVFLGTECPLAKLYGKRLAELDREYAPQGVQIVGINSNQQDTLQEIARYAHKHGIEFPVLKDAGARVADLFGATRTPEAFVLDGQRTVRYHGRIDDQYGVGAARNQPTRSELVDAIEAVLSGRLVAAPSTQAVGCLIGRREPSESDGAVTYAKDIAPILQARCVTCHREEQIAPFALTDYEDVAAWADTMLEVIAAERMPPWHANPDHGEFINDARMPAAEKKLFRQWVHDGAPLGDPDDVPPPREYPDGWQIPGPRTIFRMPEPFDVPATGTVAYQHFWFDPGFTEDKWVYAAEARPGNREVVHHLILFYVPPGQNGFRPEDPLLNAVAAFAPGMPAISGPEEYAVRIPARSKLVFQVHYTPNGSPQKDRSEAALAFADPAKVSHEVHVTAGYNFRFLIPPGAPDYVVRHDLRIPRDTLAYSLTPHMHYRGKSFRFTARYPDGGEEILLDVPRYDFNWQNTYLLMKPKRLPAGTVVHMEAHFDNSADNPLNPDPTQRVHWGDQTWDEMMLGTMTTSAADQDLRLGAPIVEPSLDEATDERNVRFHYRPLATEGAVDAVYLAGTFNEWKPTGLKMAGPDDEGFYAAELALTPGRYEYKFVVNGTEWRMDPSNREITVEYGNSVLIVK
jgi:peroxiredoxin